MYSKKAKQQVTEKFAKQEFIILTQDQYPQHIALQCVNDKCDLLKGIGKDDLIKVTFNLNGKPFTNKQGVEVVMTNLNAYKIESLSKGTEQQTTPPPAKKTPPPAADLPKDDEDLPF
jgi:carbamoylphosphate synthase large subunit